MLSLYVSLAVLGLCAVDPIGIGIMPILLSQTRPYKRSFIFIGGSLTSLLIVGIIFAKGLGAVVIHFDRNNSQFLSTLEIIGGVILLLTGVFLYIQLCSDKLSAAPKGRLLSFLTKNDIRLFTAGAILVAIQSVVDVVFVVAMIKVGKTHLSFINMFGAVASYAIAAIVLQLGVVLAFRAAPDIHKAKTLDCVNNLLNKYANQALIAISFILGCLLLILGLA